MRFRAREETPFKRWKLTDEDWRNREHWEDYEVAVNDMVAHCSTRIAPWTLVEANDKRFARVKVLRTFADALEGALTGKTGLALPEAKGPSKKKHGKPGKRGKHGGGGKKHRS